MNTGTVDIQMVDMKTRQVSAFPGSKGLFSPRWSPDGRYLAAINAEGSHKLMLYEFRTQKWSEWLAAADDVNYPYWSADSRYIVYDNFRYRQSQMSPRKGGRYPSRRYVQPERPVPLLRRLGIVERPRPDDSRLFVRDLSTQDIYALDVDLP
jgi:eukaryotic-like serine/threonine-protein kinase